MTEPLGLSALIGPTKMGEILGRSRRWAYSQLKEWFDEQERGGEQRVWVKKCKSKRTFRTSYAIIQREFPGVVRDPFVTRKLRDHEQAIDFLTKRMIDLTNQLQAIHLRLGPKRAS